MAASWRQVLRVVGRGARGCRLGKYGSGLVRGALDAMLLGTGLIGGDDDSPEPDKDNARRAFAIAQDMIRAARAVRPPRNRFGERADSLQIRVGIHCGDVTCGVLGKLQPRFQVFGSAVNMAARMEQSGAASQIHVSQDFYSVVDLPESVWSARRRVAVKNMGEVDTYYHQVVDEG